jgi:hypothetical protein
MLHGIVALLDLVANLDGMPLRRSARPLAWKRGRLRKAHLDLFLAVVLRLSHELASELEQIRSRPGAVQHHVGSRVPRRRRRPTGAVDAGPSNCRMHRRSNKCAGRECPEGGDTSDAWRDAATDCDSLGIPDISSPQNFRSTAVLRTWALSYQRRNGGEIPPQYHGHR